MMPAARMTMPMFLIDSRRKNVPFEFWSKSYQTTGGSVSWRTIINPMQMRIRERLVRTIRQQTPCSKNSDYKGLNVKTIVKRILKS